MTQTTKEQADIELAVAQRQKVLAEIEVLRRTTPLTETIKLIGSMVLGIGGAVAAIAGFQLAEVKAEKLKAEASAAEKARAAAQADVDRLNASRTTLSREIGELQKSLQSAKKDYADISDRLTAAERETQSPALSSTLKNLQQQCQRGGHRPARGGAGRRAERHGHIPGHPGGTAVCAHGRRAGCRVRGVDGQPCPRSRADPCPAELAEPNLNNANGLYNCIAVLLRVDRALLKPHLADIRNLAERAKANGPKTAERADQLLRLLAEAQ